jgi:hypothetical protein
VRLTFRLAVAVTLAGIALSGCGGEEEETGDLAVELGTDVRLPELDPTALEPPPRFTKAEEEALSQLLQGNLDRVTEGDVRDLQRKLDAFAASSRARRRRVLADRRATEDAGVDAEGSSPAEERLIAGYHRLVQAMREESDLNLTAVEQVMDDDRRLILLVRSAGSALAGEGSGEYRSALRRTVAATRRSEGGQDLQAAESKASDRVVRLGTELGSVVSRSPELRRLAARVERRYPKSLLATVTSAYAETP